MIDLNYCECCGITYAEAGQDSRWISKTGSNCDRRICMFCASIIPGDIVELALGITAYIGRSGSPWHIGNYKEYPELKKRLKEVQEIQGSYVSYKQEIPSDRICPRCNKTLIEKTSESIFGETYKVKKCNSCGYCS